MGIPFSDSIKVIDSVGVTTTSYGYDISKRQQIAVQFICTSYNTGPGTFTIDLSNDGSNWITGCAFLDATATAVGTYVTSKALSSATNAGAYVTAGFKAIRVVLTTSGTNSVYSAILQNGG